jgi:endonuclease
MIGVGRGGKVLPGGGSGAPRLPPVRLVIARCSVDYVGRLTAHLPSAVRLVLVKADGSVSVHADDRAYKPLNWMSPPCSVLEAEGVWRVTNPAGEQLVLTMEEVLHDSSHHLGVDPGLVKDGVEAHLQELLADRCSSIEDGLVLVRREWPTDIGPVDLMCRDGEGRAVAVEIKRKAEIAGVEQLTRYLQRLDRDPLLTPVRGLLVAQSFTPQAKVLAADRGIGCVQVDYDALRGIEPLNPRLF